MKQLSKVFALAISATLIFYCGATMKNVSPDASADPADAGVDSGVGDAGTDTDAGGDPCVICPDPCPACPTPLVREVHDVETSPDASVVIPVPDFNQGVVIQGYLRASSGSGPFWNGNHEDCTPRVYTEPPSGYPNLPVPSVLYPEGIYRRCLVVIIRPGP